MDPSVTAGQPVFRRVLLKLSGESFCRPGPGGHQCRRSQPDRPADLAGRGAGRSARDRRGGWQHPPRRAALAAAPT